MKHIPHLLLLALTGILAACQPLTPAIDLNIAGEAAGRFTGVLVTTDGEVVQDFVLELHRATDDRVSAEPFDNNNQGGRFIGFEMQLMRSGAVIHHQLGKEENGIFVLDAAVTPDQLRFDLPGGLQFEGVRTKNYFE